MDRATRKANLKKLQLPSTTGNKSKRKTSQSSRSTVTANTAISNYFLTPEKLNNKKDEAMNISPVAPEVNLLKKDAPQSDVIKIGPRPKRTKLDAFIFQDPHNIPDSIKNARKSLNNEDLIVPEKKAKKAPKLTTGSQAQNSKVTRAKKQTTIKSAFLRNEQLFAEIAAQHCAADQFDGDDIQLALAISKSEAESKGIKTSNENEEVNLINGDTEADLIREKLKRYGFKTAEKKDYNTFAAAFLPKVNNRRQKSKWANKFTALTLRSSENQLKKLQGNIEKLLNSQFRPKPLSEYEKFLPNYKLQSILLKNSGVHEEKKRIFQTAENINRSNELFFVTDLFETKNLPAGHLLKDWTAIQGRDLTPDQKNKKSIERLKALENVYQELEEYFNSHKILDWSVESEQKQNEKSLSNKKESINKDKSDKKETLLTLKNTLDASKILVKIENVELCKNSNFKENNSLNVEKLNNDNSKTILSDSSCDKKILQLLPTSKSLATMQVSSCSINSQNTINTSQKNRSKSPDIFADSDVEMEEIEKADVVKTAVETINNVRTDKNVSSSLDEVGDNITTYEVFSSDEVKNTSLSDVIKSAAKESLPNTSIQSSDEKIIDLTQDDLRLPTNNKSNDDLNLSKPIVEIDLFAESPLQEEEHDNTDINSKSQLLKCMQEKQTEETTKFTLSLETHDSEEQIIENKREESFKLSPNLKPQKHFKDLSRHEEDEDIILRELAMDESNISFLNFQGSKQLQTSFHRKTAPAGNNIIENELTDNDTTFQKICNKYLNCKPNNTQQKKTDFGENCTEVLASIQTPQKCDDDLKNLTMDFDITVDNFITLKRKSLSFTVKSPLKYVTNDTDAVLSKSQSFNNNKLNVSIDLTQNNDEDDNDDDEANVAVEEDDECLVLSDDEINYSIWQANKTLNFQTSPPTDHQNKFDIESSSDEEDLISCQENIIEFPHQDNNDKKLSYLDFRDKEKQEKTLPKIDLGTEELMSNFEILTSKYVTSDSPVYYITKPERSEFGIMEEYSEPLDFTPTKILTEASFLSSPTEMTAPMKRYSSCQETSQKFHDLINNIPTKSPSLSLDDNFNDFDEFDNLLNTSPLKTARCTIKPQGFDKLLTGEISFKESQKTLEKKTDILASETHEIEFNNKIYTVRYTCSPKPDYTKYSEAELLKELYQFGIKPLKRKQAVKMLEYIYNQTHPILMEDEDATQQDDVDVVQLDDLDFGPCTSKEAIKAQKLKSKSSESVFNAQKEYKKEVAANFVQNTNQKLNLQDSCGLEMLRHAIDLRPDLPDEKYILQTNVTKKTPQPLLPLHIAWYNLVCSNRKLHETILMYEPIDLQEIYLFLKTLGYRYDPKDLKTFFDRRCIIFRYDLTGAAGSNGQAKATNRHVRKSKKTKIAKN